VFGLLTFMESLLEWQNIFESMDCCLQSILSQTK